MNATRDPDSAAAAIAAAIGEPARARMLYCLLDGHARTSTELAVLAEVTPSTASAHLNRLRAESLVTVAAQGKHRYYRLGGPDVARVLEGLDVLAGGARPPFVPPTPLRLRFARTCYDHLAGTVGVLLHDRFIALGWLAARPGRESTDYDLTPVGERALAGLGVDVGEARRLRRRFAYDCLDWSERRPHLAGAIGAAFLKMALRRKWLVPDLDSRILSVSRRGRSELAGRLGVCW